MPTAGQLYQNKIIITKKMATSSLKFLSIYVYVYTHAYFQWVMT